VQIEKVRWTPLSGWRTEKSSGGGPADLVIYFGDRDALQDGTRYAELRAAYPGAKIIGGSATATILGSDLDRSNVVAAAISFAHTRVAVTQWADVAGANTRVCAEAIGHTLAGPDLAGVFVLSDGLRVNGSSLAADLNNVFRGSCPIFGGMTANVFDYHTEAFAGADAPPASGVVAALGFYGESIRLSLGRACGWNAFGPRRKITRSSANVLFELDNRPAYALYERYLGDEVGSGTHTGNFYPLQISPPDQPEHVVVRTVLEMDRVNGFLTFAGDVPEGWMARLMRGNLDHLALAAADAARQVRIGLPTTSHGDQLALMVSCAARHLLMGQRTVEEIAYARQELGPNVQSLGFYSYGEISPADSSWTAELHNQTMAIIGLTETEC
jgi:hypothetical protein